MNKSTISRGDLTIDLLDVGGKMAVRKFWKQMAIDADLNAGLIDDSEARTRRRVIQRESDYFGALDGASKFVRGDAIAGLLITAINILGGLLVGVTQYSMSAGDAFDSYATLTIGDGLVSQIPASVLNLLVFEF